MTAPAVPTIVMDNGSYNLRAGFPEERAPRVSIPSFVGQPRNKGVAMAAGMHEFEIGYEAQKLQGQLHCNQPVRKGEVTNWDDLERLWSHVLFKELQVTPENYCLVMTVPANATKSQKEKTLELTMETFNAHSLYLGSAPVLSLYAYGRTSGLVIDSGLDVSSAIPIHEGYALGRHVATSPVAGDSLTHYLSSLLNEKGYNFGTQLEMQLVSDVKEKYCFVNHHSTSDRSNSETEYFRLPDGQTIPMESHRYDCPEALFNFSLLGEHLIPKYKVFADAGYEYEPGLPKGLSWLAYAAIHNCEPFLRPTLFDNMVLCGGSSLFAGTRQRIEDEIIQFYKEMHPNEGVIPISCAEMACRQYTSWVGGCMIAMTPMFPHLCVSRAEYHEQGARIIHCKSL